MLEGSGSRKVQKGQSFMQQRENEMKSLGFPMVEISAKWNRTYKKERKPTNHKVVMTKPEQAHTGLLEVVGGVDNGGL